MFLTLVTAPMTVGTMLELTVLSGHVVGRLTMRCLGTAHSERGGEKKIEHCTVIPKNRGETRCRTATGVVCRSHAVICGI